MFIVRTAFWLGIIVMVMPSDPEQQQRLKAAARDGLVQVSTLCERQQVACAKASAAWDVFKVKAEAAGKMAFSLAMEQMSNRPVPSAAEKAPTGAATGTLREEDRTQPWRAETTRGRS